MTGECDWIDTSVIDNLGGWPTTVVARVCLNQRPPHRYESVGDQATDFA